MTANNKRKQEVDILLSHYIDNLHKASYNITNGDKYSSKVERNLNKIEDLVDNIRSLRSEYKQLLVL